MRKIIISLIIFLSIMFSSTFAYNMTEKDIKLINNINSKLDLYNKKISKNIIIKLEKIITKLSKKKLIKVYKKINKIDFENKKYTKYKDLLIYIKLRIWLEIIKNKNLNIWLERTVNVPKRLKLKNKYRLKFYNNWEKIYNVKYVEKNHEYFINELNVPTKLKFDARFIRTDNIFYTLTSVSWDLNDDWTIDKTWKTLDLDVEWNKIIMVEYKFTHRRFKDDIVTLKERIYIKSFKKDAILKLKITPETKYVPTYVRFDASLTQIKWKNIDKFVYDYGDGTQVDERDAINPAYKYTLPGEYNIKLTVITTDWSEYKLEKN